MTCLVAGLPAAVTAQLADRKVLSLAAVKQIVNAAEAEAVRNGWNVSIAVVDANGELLAFRRLDGAIIASVDIARAKARTAARMGRPTKALEDAVAGGRNAILSIPDLLLLQGGLPITVAGVAIGGIGVSGVTSEQDEAIAAAGLAALRP
jgi:uncharacterized protein GlcG (DUF336 family)